MEPYYYDDEPVVLNTRPGRNRLRHNSEHPNRVPVYYNTRYYEDGEGLLIPAMGSARPRSASVAGARRPPAQIQIINEQAGWEQHSPVRGAHHRHSSHGHDHRGHDHHHEDYDDDSFDEHPHSPRPRRRQPSRSHESRSPSPFVVDPEYERKMRKLEELEKKEEEEEARERFEKARILEEAAKAKKKMEQDELIKKAIEEHNEKIEKEKLKKEKEKKEADAAFKERVKSTFGAAGYDEESIEKILTKGEKGKSGRSKEKKPILDLTRPTYIKVHRKHLLPDTLDHYNLPWQWDDRDSNFLIIKRWIPEQQQEDLFEHTRRLRDKKLLTDASADLKKERDKLLVVRRKSPGRIGSPSRAWMFT